MDYKNISGLDELFQYLREVSDTRQEEIEKDTEISTTALSFYENNQRFPPLDTLVEFLDFFGGKIWIETDFGEWVIRKSESNEKRVRLEYRESEDQPFEGLPVDEVEDIVSLIQKRRQRHD